jgi:hypothetical protein
LIEPKFQKAYYRKGIALQKTNQNFEALAAVEAGLKIGQNADLEKL